VTLHHPLHVAGKCIIWLLFSRNIATCDSLMWFHCNVGYFLNPRYQYSDNVHNDGEVRSCTIDVIRPYRGIRTIGLMLRERCIDVTYKYYVFICLLIIY